ncbi:MAG: hypothetical protein LBE62_12570 [Azonexus sp.]|jgi:hypothetical protein|nr:hypothetical protein [Azonexus sp.]
MSRRFLYLDAHRLSAYLWRRGQFFFEGSFADSDEGLFAFKHYLAGQSGSDFALLTNVVEEERVIETIPFLQGADRKALIARRLARHFMGSPFAAFTSLGYETGQRKNEKLLLAALTNPAQIEPWLKFIADVSAPLSGIYTVAQLGGGLLKKLGSGQRACILLTMQDRSLRESYLKDGRTLFSRTAPVNDNDIDSSARSFAAEAVKLQQYLIGQRLISRDDRLPVIIIAAPTAVPAIAKACAEYGESSGALDFSIIDSHLAARKIGLKTLPADDRCDLLFLQLLATAPPRQQFAAASHRHDYLLARLRYGIVGAGLVVFLGGILFASHEAWTARALRQEAAALSSGETELAARYDQIAATFPQLATDDTPLDNATLGRLTARYATLSQQRHPGPALRRLGEVLDQTPAIILDRLDWRLGQTPADGAPDAAPPLDSDDETLVVSGHVQLAWAASAREVLVSFNAFVDRLRQDPDNRVRILQPPFDLESERPLRGGGERDETAQAQPFRIEIRRLEKP